MPKIHMFMVTSPTRGLAGAMNQNMSLQALIMAGGALLHGVGAFLREAAGMCPLAGRRAEVGVVTDGDRPDVAG